jgi:hypothetical protein
VRTRVARLRSQLRELPVVVTGMLIGLVLVGTVGGGVGLVIGLAVHPPTAWAAALEVGAPAGAVGWVLGLVAGLVVRWLAPDDPPAGPVDDDSRPVVPAC